jgi:fixL-related histidine kinase
MDTHTTSNEIQIELTDEVAQGTYVNLAVIAHSEDEFVFDFIRLVPGVPKAKVKCRLIMTPDNARRLLHTLDENLRQYDETQQGGGGGADDANSFGGMLPPIGKPGEA